MTNVEWTEILQEELNHFRGVLFQSPDFQTAEHTYISYRFDCPEFEILKQKYQIAEIAGKGSPFEKTARLTEYFAPRLTHKGDFSEHVGCNALALLDYALNKPHCGINCVNKSKILQECSLALGIYARRVWLMPCSPYDTDNHVVTEIFDVRANKWIMLDVTSGGYFADRNGTPLSVLELRKIMSDGEICRFVKIARGIGTPFPNEETEALYYCRYFAKNLFWLATEENNGFGNDGKRILFLPENFRINEWLYKNAETRGETVHPETDNRKIGGVSVLTATPFS